jgi:tRNA(Ile)-lysidine synthase
VLAELRRFFSSTAPATPDDTIVVAFSGGPDSCALLLGLCRLRDETWPSVIAAHLDHALDDGSRSRCERAAQLAARLEVPFRSTRRDVRAARRGRVTLEEAARAERYAFLESVRLATGARWVATAHHRDDQLETLLLRLLQGTGPFGLSGIRPRLGNVVRPLLRLGRSALREATASAGLEPIDDPTNHELDTARNRLRLLLLPALLEREPELAERAATLAEAAAGARDTLERALGELLDVEPGDGVDSTTTTIAVAALRGLPPALQAIALAALHRWAGAPYPPSGAACRELARQLAAGAGIGGDCGGGWRWRARGDRLQVVPPL